MFPLMNYKHVVHVCRVTGTGYHQITTKLILLKQNKEHLNLLIQPAAILSGSWGENAPPPQF